MTKQFLLPDLGEGLPDATIVEWYVKVGDVIRLDENLVSMETAKAVVDVPSPVSGKVLKLAGAAGDIIVTGTPTGAGARLDPPVWLRPGDVVEVSAESLDKTRGYAQGERVNLEKALRAHDRLGGHIVTGHVDAVGSVSVFERVGESWLLQVRPGLQYSLLVLPYYCSWQ